MKTKSMKIVEVGVTINKRSVLKIAAEVFFKNKKTNLCKIKTPKSFVTVEFSGPRNNEQFICNNAQITKIFSRS